MRTPAVADLVAVEEADVYKAGRLAGRLRRDGDDVVFGYADDYLSDAGAPAVATTLRKGAEPVRATAGSVPPFFAGLLPEGVRLQAVTSGAHTSADGLGLAERAMTRSLDRIVAGSRSGLERLPEIGFDESTTHRLRELIAQRCDELSG